MMTAHSFYRPLSGLDLLGRTADDPRERGRVVLESLMRIEEVESEVRAMTAVARREAAMATATAARGPLAGMPIAVKDIFDTNEFVTSYGSPIYESQQPKSDAAIVTLLRRNGAVIMGKTVTSEFAYMSPTATRNPCGLGRTAGGSSSGSAAAVAAGIVPFAIGSQTGGSTIRPASFCGVAGYKPTFGILPTVGMKCFSWSFDTIGLFAAGVRDVAYLAQILSGRQLAVERVSTSPVFGVPDSYPWTEPSANAGAVLDIAARAIEDAGGRIRRVRFAPWMADLISAHDTIQSYEAYQALGFEYDHHRADLSPKLAAFLERAAHVDTATYAKACVSMEQAKDRLSELFDGITALLTPSAPDEALDGLGSTGDPAFNRNWTLLGCPCVNVPGLWGARGGPIGVQVICRPRDDARCLDAAAFVERAITGIVGLFPQHRE
ncbi:amidase [Paraburkholderia xenovorans]|nr:amidase [Paraburkholderia xenovorans]